MFIGVVNDSNYNKKMREICAVCTSHGGALCAFMLLVLLVAICIRIWWHNICDVSIVSKLSVFNCSIIFFLLYNMVASNCWAIKRT